MSQPLNEQLAAIGRGHQLPPEVSEVIANSILAGAEGGVKGLRIGDRAPDFTLANEEGKPFSLYRRLESTPVVLCFFRGEWCPYCTLEVRELKRAVPRIRELGASLVCVHPQQLDVSKRIAEPHQEGFDVCHDELQNVIAAYHVKFDVHPPLIALYRDTFGLDLSQLNANGQWNLPVPACFIIDRDKIIKGRQFSHDFTVRVEPRYILDALHALPSASAEFALT